MQQRVPIHALLWNILRVGETQDRPGSVLVQKSGHVDDDVQISALDALDERVFTSEKCWNSSEEEDAGDLKRSALNEWVETWSCLNAQEGKFWKSNRMFVTDENSWKTWKSNQKRMNNWFRTA